MKRVQYACLNQTIHFKLNKDIPKDEAIKDVENEYESYKLLLKNNKTKHKIISENRQEDGSIQIKVKKQLSNYEVGNYLE